jgi:hypothetical protein
VVVAVEPPGGFATIMDRCGCELELMWSDFGSGSWLLEEVKWIGPAVLPPYSRYAVYR